MSYDLIFTKTRATNVSMINKIELQKFTQKELQEYWLTIFKNPAPKGYTKSLLIKEIIWQSQYNSLSKELQTRIDKLVEQYFVSKKVDIKKIKKSHISIGTKFIREFKGEKYEVTAVDGGFKFNDKLYKTLSAVANEITGTHWNGKKFFGVANG